MSQIKRIKSYWELDEYKVWKKTFNFVCTWQDWKDYVFNCIYKYDLGYLIESADILPKTINTARVFSTKERAIEYLKKIMNEIWFKNQFSDLLMPWEWTDNEFVDEYKDEFNKIYDVNQLEVWKKKESWIQEIFRYGKRWAKLGLLDLLVPRTSFVKFKFQTSQGTTHVVDVTYTKEKGYTYVISWSKLSETIKVWLEFTIALGSTLSCLNFIGKDQSSIISAYKLQNIGNAKREAKGRSIDPDVYHTEALFKRAWG